MFIKEITIQGFKSYKDQTRTDPFSSHLNVIIGQNGSGKSNFFFAIEFVLSDETTFSTPEARQALLHEGSGLAVMSAFVEIKFDNTAERFPLAADEVVIRRTIGVKKDEYFVNKRHCTKADVNRDLESAGFSRSNPYYIVKQGKIQGLTMMQDKERLTLLKEIAGSKVYDENRKASIAILKEAEQRKAKIDESILGLETRLGQLEDEKEELVAYQQLDKTRRSLENGLYEQDLAQTRAELEEVENARVQESEDVQKTHKDASTVHERLQEADAAIRTLSAALASLQREREAINDERQDLIAVKTRLEIDVHEGNEVAVTNETRTQAIRTELKALTRAIAKEESALEALRPEFEQNLAAEQAAAAQVAELEQVRATLYARQGRAAQFADQKARDKFLKSEVAQLEEAARRKTGIVNDLKDEVEKLRQTIDSREAMAAGLKDKAEADRKALDGADKRYEKLRAQRDDLITQRKEAWRRDADADGELEAAHTELRKAERDLQSSMAKATWDGLQAVKRIAAAEGLAGVYGPVIELVSVEAPLMPSVELVGGNSLFNVVVDTDETAERLLQALNREHAGRVTLMPLNRMVVSTRELPHNADVFPLIERIDFDERYAPAIRHIFGLTLVCRDITIASQFAKSHDIDCITPEGDKVARKGALTGGYLDTRRMRLMAQGRVNQAAATIREKRQSIETDKDMATALDQQVTVVLGELQKVEAERAELMGALEHARLEAKRAGQDAASARSQHERQSRLLTDATAELASLSAQVESAKAELKTTLNDGLSAGERQRLDDAVAGLDVAVRDHAAAAAARTSAEVRKQAAEATLQDNLLKRRGELTDELERLSMAQRGKTVSGADRELAAADLQLAELTARAGALDTTIAEKTGRLAELQAAADALKTEDVAQARALLDRSSVVERLLQKRTLLVQKKEEAMRKIRELGSLPADYRDYVSLPAKRLLGMLGDTNEKLKRYSHVNKKALDQYVSSSELHESLQRRKADAEAEAEAIHELIRTTDAQKEEAIDRTFKGVAKEFAAVFRELVPRGQGSLVMLRAGAAGAAAADGGGPAEEGADENQAPDDANALSAPPPRADKYCGVALRVSFTGAGDTLQMAQLSGGQKSLVAIALVFAIQRTDPAPFYLFDEVDAALDASHRTAVAALIQRQAQTAQFVTTTFRPEMLVHADRFFQVLYMPAAKVSTVRTVDRAIAEDFVRGAMAAEDAEAEARAGEE